MGLRDYLRVLREHWRFAIVWLLIGLGGAAAAVALTPKTYDSHAQLFVATSDVNGSNAYQGGLFSQERVKSYTQIVNSPPVIGGVIKQLGLHTTPEKLAAQISATAPLDTVLIDIKVADTSPQRAQAIADATAVQFTRFVAGIEQTSGSGSPLIKVSMVRPSSPPTSAASPQPALYLAIGAVAGLVIGLSGALVRGSLDSRIKTHDGVRRDLGLPTLGVVPNDRGLHGATTLPDPHRSLRAEAISQLRSSVCYAGGDHMPRSIVVASPAAADGRTAVVVDLALSMARTGHRVVLVEGDLRSPRLSGYLGLPDGPGLTDLLAGRARLAEALREWGDGLLRVLPAGSPVVDPAELLARPGLAELLRGLEERADLVLLDSPPLLPYSDAGELAAATGEVLLVIRADRTPRAQAQEAMDTLARVRAQVIGAVLTRAPDHRGLARWRSRTAPVTEAADAHPAPWRTPPRTSPAEPKLPLEVDGHHLPGGLPVDRRSRRAR